MGKDKNEIRITISSLERIALFLEGMKAGKGDLLPLGTEDLEQLWTAMKYLEDYKSE